MYSFEFSLSFLLALICTGGILVFIIYLKYQNSGESSKKAIRTNGYEALPHDILHRIFALWDDPRELQRAGATCKAWRNASKSFTPMKGLEFKSECDESGRQPQEYLFCAIGFQGDKPNGGLLKEDINSCCPGKDQDDTSSKISGDVLPAGGTDLTLPISEAKSSLNQNICGLSDDVTLPPVEFLKTGGFFYDHTEQIRDQSIDDYIQENPVVKPYVLYDKTEVCLCTNDGISLWLGFLTLLMVTFEAGKSWGGSFELQHLRMKNGKKCEINMPPACLGTFGNLLLDLAKLAKLLICYYSDKKKNTALFIRRLYDCMVTPKVGDSSSPEGQLRYLRYLRNHLAFSTSARRIALFKAIYQALMSMVGDERTNFLKVLTEVTRRMAPWKDIARFHKLLFKVLTFKLDKPNKNTVRYGATLKEFLRFLRNFLEHGAQHTIVDGQQLMENVEELDYIAATEFSSHIEDMLYSLVMELDMTGKLQIPWSNYCGCVE